MKTISDNLYVITAGMLFIGLFSVMPCVGYGQALGASGTTYYACDCGTDADAACVAGNDGAAGTTPETAWKTIEKARLAFAGLSAGDTIAFCRGGSFTVDGHDWENHNCRAETPCTLTDYVPAWASSNTKRALVISPVDRTAFSFTDSAYADHEEGYIVSNLDVRGTDGTGIGFFFFNDIDDVILTDLIISRFDIGVLIQGSNPPNPYSDGRNERITLKNSRIVDNASQGFEGSCNGCAVLNNVFDNNGYRGEIFYHNLYWDGASESADGRIIGNTLSRSAMVGNICHSVSLIVHGKHRNLTIERNILQEATGAAGMECWGIAVDTGYQSAEGFSGLVIRGNIIKNMGNVGIGLNACTDCLIERNRIIQENAFSTAAIAIPDRERSIEDTPMNNVTVRNNQIRLSSPINQTALILGGEGTGHISTGNAVTYSGESTNWSCFGYPLPLYSYTTIDKNICRFPFAAAGKWEAATGSLAEWQAVSGFDRHSVRR
jgi:hypothetical protein